MRTFYFHLLSIMLLLMAAPSMAQSTSECLDSLQRVEKNLELQGLQLVAQRDSIHRIIAQCKTDQEILPQLAALEKLDKKSVQIAKRIDKVQHEMEVERARLEQAERDAKLANKQAAVQALSPVPLKGELNGHPWVDLGLPSGTKWGTYNVGTSQIHGVGTRIAWSELATKKTFSPAAYSLTDVELPCYAGNAQYDLATAKWGEGWYTPTKQQWDELVEHCDWDYVMINGIYGVLFTSTKTYNYIFLPSTGYTDDETYKLIHTKYNGQYWSSTGSNHGGAHCYIDNYEHGYMTTVPVYGARCVRAVCGLSCELASAAQNTADVVQTIQETVSAVQQTTATAQQTANEVQQKTHSAKQIAESVQQTSKTVKQAVKTVKTLQKIFGR